nr:MAG TPA: hypothetical protein [Caudoviricetes sp.]
MYIHFRISFLMNGLLQMKPIALSLEEKQHFPSEKQLNI